MSMKLDTTNLNALFDQFGFGDYLKGVNVASDNGTRYFAICANFEPNTESTAPLKTIIKEKIGDAIVDRIFKDAPNDLVVPTNGVFTSSGPHFPLAETSRLVFPSDRGIWHSAYFEQPETADRLRQWLPTPAVV